MKIRSFYTSILSLILVLNFIGCNAPVKELKFGIERTLNAKEYPIPELIIPHFITLQRNHLIFLQANPVRDHKIFSFFTLPDMHMAFEYGTIGRGNEEFILPMFCGSSSDSLLYIWGKPDLKKITKYEVDTSGKRLNPLKEISLHKYETFNQLYVIGDSVVIYNAMPAEFAIKRINLTGGGIRKIDFETLGTGSSYEPNCVIISSNDNYIAACYRFQKKLTIYDTNLKIISEIQWGKDDNLRKMKERDFESLALHYVNIYCSDKYVYALYRGKTSREYKEAGYTGDIMEVFDFKGAPVARYSFDKSPVLFVVDEDRQKIYGYNSMDENKILVYELI